MFQRTQFAYLAVLAMVGSIVSAQSLTKKHDLPGQKLPVQAVSFSADGKLVAAGDGEIGGNKEYGPGAVGFFRVFEVESKREVIRRKVGGPVGGVAISPKGKYAISSSFKDVKAYVLLTHDQHRDYSDRPKGFGAMVLTSDGKHVVAVTRGETGAGPIMVWDFNTRLVAHRLPGAFTTLKLSQDGTTLAAGTDDNRVAVFGTSDWKQKAVLGKASGHRISAVAVSKDGQKVFGWANATGGRVWNASGGEAVASLKITDALRPTMDRVHDASFTPDGGSVLTAGANLQFWNAASGEASGEPIKGVEKSGDVRCVAFSPDGASVATGGSDDGVVTIWSFGN